ncbi:MAG: hypothetical protein AAB542_04390 [Patescibacteria group bacterium]
MKSKKEDKQHIDRITRMVNRAEKKAIEFVKKNLAVDPDLRLKGTSSHSLNLQ